MKTQTAPRGFRTTATPKAARQTQTAPHRKACGGSPPKETATPANPLRALFSDTELALIDSKCRALGRSAVEIVCASLKRWSTETPTLAEEDAHLRNDDDRAPAAVTTAPALAGERFEGILGREVARITTAWGSLETIYCHGHTYYWVFEAVEILADGEWRAWEEWKSLKHPGVIDGAALLAAIPAERLRRSWVLESSWTPEDIADWFESNEIAPPAGFASTLESYHWREGIWREEIERKAVAAERRRIARVMNAALAAAPLAA